MKTSKVYSFNKLKIIEISILILSVFFASIFIFRSHLNSQMLGRSVDTRSFIAQLEHWYRTFGDFQNFRDVYFFYPVTNGFGYSDGYFLLSFPYSLLRSLDFSLVSAWSIVTILTQIVGGIGWILLSRKLYSNFSTQLFFVITMMLSATLVTRIEGLPTSSAGFSLISFIFLLLYKLVYSANQENKYYLTLVLIFYLILLALTFWYVAFFMILHIFLFFILFLIFRRNLNLKIILNDLMFYSKKVKFLVIIFLSIFFLIVWSYIYLPLAGDPIRPWWEVYKNSSSLRHIFFSTNLNNGFLYQLFNISYSAYPEERYIGLPIFFSFIFFSIALYLLISFFKNRKIQIGFFVFINLLVSLLLTLLFMRIGADFSLFKIFWDFIPGMNSMRAPSRYTIILFFSISIFIFSYFDVMQKKKKFLLILVMFLVTIDQIKPALAGWNGNEYISNSSLSHVSFLQNNCDYFVLEIPGGWWNDKAQAMGLAQISNVRSATGGSGGFPIGYPEQTPGSEGDLLGLLAWSNFGLDDKRGCLIIDEVSLPIKSFDQEPKINLREGFYPIESTESNYWAWVGQNNAVFYVSASAPEYPKIELEFMVKSPPCLSSQSIKVLHDNNLIKTIAAEQKSQKFIFSLKNSIHGVNRIELVSNKPPCIVSGDNRELLFELKNFTVSAG